MTTKVIVRSPKNNHLDVQVDVVAVTTFGKEAASTSHHIPDGEERSFYVHSTQELRIREVPKK